MRRGCLLIALWSIFLSGCQEDCNRYELASSGRGVVYRLDKKTGEVWLLEGRDSYRTRTPEEMAARAEASRRQAEAERRAWEAQVDAEEPMSSSGDAGRFDDILDQVESEGSQ